MKIKKLLILFIILPIVFFTGCWNSREINTLAITVCTGIDKTKDGYMLTQQIINPKAIASKKSTDETPVIIYSDTGKDLFEIKRKLTTECPRKIYNSHLRIVVLGETLAKDGIKNIIDFFARGEEYRTDFYFVIAKGTTANEVLKILTPLENIPGIEMFNMLKTSEKVWAPTRGIRIIELVNSIIADGKNPVVSGIEITKGSSKAEATDALKVTNGPNRLKYTSLGAFKKDKLTGWLNESESKGYNYITGNVKSSVGYAYYEGKDKITAEVMSAKSTMKAVLVNGKPVINVKIDIKQNIGAIEGDFDVSKEENKGILSEIGEKKIKLMCEDSVNKAQKELKTDIFGFGEVIHRTYPKLWEKLKDNWNDEFSDLKVNIEVKVKTNQLGQITKPFFSKEK